MSKNTKRNTGIAKPGFVRKTVTIPAELEDFTDQQSRRPEHSGNLSSYIRNLILEDRNRFTKQAA